MNINKNKKKKRHRFSSFFCLRIKKNKTYSQFPDFGYSFLRVSY